MQAIYSLNDIVTVLYFNYVRSHNIIFLFIWSFNPKTQINVRLPYIQASADAVTPTMFESND